MTCTEVICAAGQHDLSCLPVGSSISLSLYPYSQLTGSGHALHSVQQQAYLHKAVVHFPLSQPWQQCSASVQSLHDHTCLCVPDVLLSTGIQLSVG